MADINPQDDQHRLAWVASTGTGSIGWCAAARAKRKAAIVAMLQLQNASGLALRRLLFRSCSNSLTRDLGVVWVDNSNAKASII